MWSLYAGLLLTVGIIRKRRGLRLLAITIFGLTVAKMAVVDLWLLEPLHRTIAFTGLGCSCSSARSCTTASAT